MLWNHFLFVDLVRTFSFSEYCHIQAHNVIKKTFILVCPVKIQICLRIRTVWSESSNGRILDSQECNCLHMDEISDQYAWCNVAATVYCMNRWSYSVFIKLKIKKCVVFSKVLFKLKVTSENIQFSIKDSGSTHGWARRTQISRRPNRTTENTELKSWSSHDYLYVSQHSIKYHSQGCSRPKQQIMQLLCHMNIKGLLRNKPVQRPVTKRML